MSSKRKRQLRAITEGSSANFTAYVLFRGIPGCQAKMLLGLFCAEDDIRPLNAADLAIAVSETLESC